MSVVFRDIVFFLQKEAKWALCWIKKLVFKRLVLTCSQCIQTYVCSHAGVYICFLSLCIHMYVCSGRYVYTWTRLLSGEHFLPVHCRCFATYSWWRPIFHNRTRVSSWLLSFPRWQWPVVLIQQNALMDDQGGCDLGSCFHFIPDIKYLGEWKIPLQSQPLPWRWGTSSLGVLGWCKCKISQELINPHVTEVWFGTWEALALKCEFSLMMTHFPSVFVFWLLLFQCCLLSELWLSLRKMLSFVRRW
jgi:hypothetical protein